MPVRTIAGYFWVVAGLNAAIWLRTIVPAVLSADPTTVLAGTGVATNPVFVQDLALWLPLGVAAGVWLWRRRPAGYLHRRRVLAMWVLESISIARRPVVRPSERPGLPGGVVVDGSGVRSVSR